MSEQRPIDILLVEDSYDDAEMIIRALKGNNMKPNLVHKEDGAEALEFLKIKEGGPAGDRMELPKLVLLDLNMPKINGLEVLKRIRSDERTKRIPVVVFSSSKEDSDVRKCYECGVNSYIVKPVDFREFTETISTLGKYWLGLNLLPD